VIEAVLAQVSLFEHLRPDEIGRVARHFTSESLAKGEARAYGVNESDARMVVLVSGHARLEITSGTNKSHSDMEPGDRFGDMAIVSGHVRPFAIVAEAATSVATLDRQGFAAVLAEFPAIALPLAGELSTELHAKNDWLRGLLELHAEGLPVEELRVAVEEHRRELARHTASVSRLSPSAIFRRLVVQEGAEPPFWMLAGFIVSLGLARLVVFLILKYHLEQQLFALVRGGSDPNPKHMHHFNYGLVLIGAAGLGALFPFGRRALRLLGFAFGFGMGLVFDEFALLWKLNPEYADPASLIACGIAVAALVQLTYFRRFWTALLRRFWFTLRGAR
jgi:CRP-like cAMP-binding protein